MIIKMESDNWKQGKEGSTLVAVPGYILLVKQISIQCSMQDLQFEEYFVTGDLECLCIAYNCCKRCNLRNDLQLTIQDCIMFLSDCIMFILDCIMHGQSFCKLGGG